MIRATQVVLLILLIVLVLAFGALAWTAWDLHNLITGADARLNSKTGILARVEGLETKANATLVNVDKGTATWAASAKEQTQAIADLATDAHGTLSELNGVALSLHGTADALHTELDSLHKTTDQTTALAAALTSDAQTANHTIADAQPLLEASTQTVRSFQGRLNDQRIDALLDSFKSMSGSGDAILADARKVADKTTADYLRPVPWYMQPIKKGGELIDIGAAIARHTP